jgi:hypothetical protein
MFLIEKTLQTGSDGQVEGCKKLASIVSVEEPEASTAAACSIFGIKAGDRG